MLYEMHIGTFTREGTWAAAERELPDAEGPGRHLHRGDARRGFRRAVRLGLRRRRPVRPDASLRHAGRFCGVHRSRPRPGHRRHPRRRLQSPGPRRQLPQGVLRRLLHRIRTRPTGARRSTSTAPTVGPGARVLHRQRRATGSTSSISTASASTRRRTIYDDFAGAHPCGDHPRRPRSGGQAYAST